MKYLKKFESEVSTGSASGKVGVSSLPFGKGYYQSGASNGAPGIAFTPSSEPSNTTYKKMNHSREKLKERKRRIKMFKKFHKNKKISNEGLFNIFNKKHTTEISNDNNKIIEMIYNNILDFKKRTNILDIQTTKNGDEIRSELNGLRIYYNNSTKIYNLDIPPKFDADFSYDVYDLIKNNYDILSDNLSKYEEFWKTIIFKEMSEEHKIELDTKKYNI